MLRSFRSQLANVVAAAEADHATEESTPSPASSSSATSSLSSLSSPFSASLPGPPSLSLPASARPSPLLALLHSHPFHTALRDVGAVNFTARLLQVLRDDTDMSASAGQGQVGRMGLLPLLLHFIRALLQLDDASAIHSLTAASAFRKPNSAAAPSASPAFPLSSSAPSTAFHPPASSTSSYLSSFSSSSSHSASSLSSSSFSASLSSSSPRPDAAVVFGLLFDCFFVLLRALLSTVAPVPPLLLAQQSMTDESLAGFSSPTSSASPSMSSSPVTATSRPSIDAALRHAAAVNDIIDSLSALMADVLLYSPYPHSSPSHAPFIARSAIHNSLVVRFLRCVSDGSPPPLPAAPPPVQLPTRRHLSSFPDVLDRVRSVIVASSDQPVPHPLPAATTAVSAPNDRTHLLDDLEQLQLRATDTALSLPRSFSSSAAGATSALLIASSSTAAHIASVEREREKERLYDRLLVPHGVSSDDHQQLTSMAIDASMTGKPPVNGIVKTEKADGAMDEPAVRDVLPLSRVMDAVAARVVTNLTARYRAMMKARKAAAASVVAGASPAALPIDRLPLFKLLYSVMTRCTALNVYECAVVVQAVAEDLFAIVHASAGSPPPSPPSSSPSLLSSLSTSSSLPPSAALLAFALSADPSFSSIFPVISDSLVLSAAALRDVVLCCTLLSFAAGEEGNHRPSNGKDKKEAVFSSTGAPPSSSSPSTVVVVKKEQDDSKSSPVDIGRHRPAISSYLASHSLRPSTASQLGLNARIASYAMRAHPYLNMSASATGSSSNLSLSSASVTSSSFSSSSSPPPASVSSVPFSTSSSLSDIRPSLHSHAPSSSSSMLHDDDDWFLPSFHDSTYSAPSSASLHSSSSAGASSSSSSSSSSASFSSSSPPLASAQFATSSAFTSSTSSSASSFVAPPILAASGGSVSEVDPYSVLSTDSSHVRVMSNVDEDEEDEADAIRQLEARAEREMAMLRSSVAGGGDDSKEVHEEDDEVAHERAIAAAAAAEEDDDSDDSAEGAEGPVHGEDDSGEDGSDDDEGGAEECDEDEGEGEVEVDGMDEPDVDIEAELSEAYSPPPMLENHIDPIEPVDAKEPHIIAEQYNGVEAAVNDTGNTTAATGRESRDGSQASPGSTFPPSPLHVFALVRECLLRCQPPLPTVLLQLINHAYCTLTAHSASVDGWETDDGSSAALTGSTSGSTGAISGATAHKSATQHSVADELRFISVPFFPDSRTFHQYIHAPLSNTLSSFSVPPAPLSPAPSVITSASSTLLSARYLLGSCLNLALFMLKAERHSQLYAQTTAASSSQSTPATTPSIQPITNQCSNSATSPVSPSTSPSRFATSAWTSTCCHLLYLFRRQVDVCKSVKKLLTAVTGSDSARHQLSDTFTYQHDFALLAILFYPTNPSMLLTPPPSPRTPPSFFHPFDSLLSSPPLAYPARLKLLHLLHRVEQQAKRRPAHFLSLVNECPQLLYVLLLLSVWLAEESEETSIPLCVRLIALASQQRWGAQSTNHHVDDSDDEDDDVEEDHEMAEEGKQREEKKSDETAQESKMDTKTDEKAADDSSAAGCPFSSLFDRLTSQPTLLTSFIEHYLLGSSDSTHRTHAQSFLFFMWTNSTPPTRAALFSQLSAWIPRIPLYGKHAQQLCHLISALVSASVESTAVDPSLADMSLVVQRVMSAVSSQSAVLSTHPMGDFFYSLSQTLNQQRQLSALTEQAKAQQKLYELYCNNLPCHVCHATNWLELKEKRSGQPTQPPTTSAGTAHLTSSSSSSTVGSVVGSSASASVPAASSSHFAASSAGASGSSSSSDLSSSAAAAHVYKLSALASDSKFGVQHRAIKLHSAFVIPALVLRIIQPSAPSSSSSSSAAAAAASSSHSYAVPQRAVKTIHIYFPSHPASDLSSLPLPFVITGVARDKRHSHWTLAKTVTLSPSQKEARISFSLPLHTSFLLIHYASFHASEQREAELLKCPRCHCDVQRGVCPQCRENAYQCRQCRNINYDNLTGFLCNECGHCKYGTFSWSVMAAPSLAVDRIKGEEECRQRISEMDIIAQQLSEMQQEGERLQRDVRSILNRCSGPLQSVKVRSDDVSVVSAESLQSLQSLEQPAFSSALFTSAVHKRSSISFASTGLASSSSSSLSASAIVSSHQPSAANPSIPGLSSPLDQLLLTRVRKHHSDLSKTFRLYLNTKREIGRYLGSSATNGPPTDTSTWRAHSTHCFLCGRDSVALLVKLLAELPASCMRGWMTAPAWMPDTFSSRGLWYWHAVLERVMVGSACWSEDDVQQCGKYLLAVLCNEPSLTSASVSYLTDHVQPVLLYTLRHPASDTAEVDPFLDFLHLLVLSQLQQCADAASPVLLAALALCVELLLASIERFDAPSVADFVIAPLLRLVTRAAQLPDVPLSAPAGSSVGLSAAARRSSSPLSVDSPAVSGEMRSPFFASLSSVGLSGVVMSPATQPLTSAAAPATASTRFSPSKAKTPLTVGALSTNSPRKRMSPAFPSLSFPPVRRSPRSSPVPSAILSSQSIDPRSSPLPAHMPAGNPFASSTSQLPPLPPLQLPAASTSAAADTAGGSVNNQCMSMSQLQALFARLSSFLVQLAVPSSVPSSLVQSPAAWSEWHAGALDDSCAQLSSHSPFVVRHVVDRWRRYANRKARRQPLPYTTVRRLLLNPVSDDVQSSTAHLLFLLSSLPAGEVMPPAAAETAQPASDLMDVEGDVKPTDDIVIDLASSQTSIAARAVSALPELRTMCLLDVLLCVLSSMTSEEARHSSHFFAVFAELLNSSPSAVVNATYKRRCVIRGVLPVILQRMAEQLTALAEREQVNSSAVLSRTQHASQSITQDPSFCLYGLSSLLIDLLSVSEVKRSFLRSPSHSSAILSSYLCMRGLVFARSRLTELTTQHLHSLVTLLFNADDKRNAIRAYLNAFNDSHAASQTSSASTSSSYNLSRSLIYILQQLVDIIRPPQPSKHYQLVLRKSPTQEEFIRGNMRRSPYSSSAFPGPLFRDIVELICSELKLTNEDNMFELLVGGKIIALDLPISKVYEKVWRPHVMQQQQHGGVAGGRDMGGAGLDMSERERLRERERDRDRQRLRARDRERMMLLGADAASSMQSDYMSDSDQSDDMAEPPMQLPTAPSVTAPMPPMTVTFRLTGLDGEATEPLVDALPDDETERVDAGEECDVMRESGVGGVSGLGQLVRRLSAIRDLSHPVDYKLVQVMLKVLTYACQLQANRRHVLDMAASDDQQLHFVGPYVLHVLMQQLILSLSAIQHIPAHVLASSSFKDEPAAKTALDLALSITQLMHAVMEQNKQDADGEEGGDVDRPATPKQPPYDTSPAPPHSSHASSAEYFQSLLALLHSPSVRAHTPLIDSVVAILPGLTFGSPDLLRLLYATVAPYWAPLPHNELPTDADSQWWIGALIDILDNTPKEGALGRHIRQFMFDRRMPHVLREYVQTHQPSRTGDSGDREMASKEDGGVTKIDLSSNTAASLNEFVDLPSLPIVLQLLNGLVAAHPPSQSECACLIPLLQQLESISSSKRIGSLSEQLLASLTYNNCHTQQLLAELRSSTKADKQKRAAERRRQLLHKLGINSSPELKGKLVLAADKVAGLTDMQEDDDLLRCSVCQEGYSYKPGQMLGMYVYVKPVHVAFDDTMTMMADGLPVESDDDELGVCTVTHFNLIHYRCHQEAVKADKKLKPPKSEWDGAMMRNAHTLTNALFPLLLPPTAFTADDDVSFDQYAQAVETYWSRFPFSTRLTLPRFMLVMEDIKMLLMRYANEESFSADSRGRR